MNPDNPNFRTKEEQRLYKIIAGLEEENAHLKTELEKCERDDELMTKLMFKKKEEVSMLKKVVDAYERQERMYKERSEKFQAENARLRVVLEVYAKISDNKWELFKRIHKDLGVMARQALQNEGE